MRWEINTRVKVLKGVKESEEGFRKQPFLFRKSEIHKSTFLVYVVRVSK